MCLRLRIKSTSTIPISVAGIIPSAVCELSNLEVSKQLIWHGNRQVEVAELFDVSKDGDQRRIVFEGDLSSVHWLGQFLDAGQIFVDGNIGRHVGSEMTGGEIVVNGHASDYLGCEIEGGKIRVEGSTGDWTGAGYLGTKAGMKGGIILVRENTGHATGSAMRRGTICVGGNTGRLTGWNMKAGTIAVGGQPGEMIGNSMVRGTIVLTSVVESDANLRLLTPTFSRGSKLQPAVLSATLRWLQGNLGQFPVVQNGNKNFRQFHGDHLKGGRGEVFLVAE